MTLIKSSISKLFISRLSTIILVFNIILSINNSFVYGRNFNKRDAGKIFAAGIVVGSIRHSDRSTLLADTHGEEHFGTITDERAHQQNEVIIERESGDTHKKSSLSPQEHMANHQSIRQEKFKNNNNERQGFLDEKWRDWKANWRNYYTALAVSVNIGSTADTLPEQHMILKIDDQEYYYSCGVFYISSSDAYVAIPPPYGAVIGSIVTNYTVVQTGGKEYVNSGGVFYLRVDNGYQVVVPPTGVIVNKLPVYARSTLIDGELYYVYGDAFYQPVFKSGAVVFKIVENTSDVSLLAPVKNPAEDRLKEIDGQAVVSRKDDLEEIARKEEELAVLDEKIDDIKKGLGAIDDNADNGLDKMLAMANEKENLVNLLEILRSKREAEERRQQIEIENLKSEQEKSKQESISMDTRKEIIHKYENIIASKYGKDMKEVAWSSLINSFPKAKELEIGDIKGLKHIYGIPLVKLRQSYIDLTVSKALSIPNINIRSKHDWGGYVYSTISHNYKSKCVNGNDVVIDYVTGLMWHQSGSDTLIEWNRAEQWLMDLNSRGYAGHNDWRLPTVEEAVSLLEFSREDRALYTDNIFGNKQNLIWTGDKLTGSESAWLVAFQLGAVRFHTDDKCYVRPVRPLN